MPLRHDPAARHPLPESAEAITPARLSMLLGAAGILKDARVQSLTFTAIGSGMLGNNLLLNLQYDRPTDAPTTLVAKLASCQPLSRQTGAALGIYLKEVRFYQELAHTLSVDVPQAYFADISGDQQNFCLLFENLMPARGGDQIGGCKLADAEAAMAAAAALHGPRWGDPSLKSFAWLDRDFPLGIYVQQYRCWAPAVRERYEALLDDAVLEVVEAFTARIDAYFELQRAPWTVTHQDFRLDNMLFAASGGRRSVAVVDWQTVLLGPGVTDVAYFIGGGLTEELRRRYERELVRRYHEALLSYGVRDYAFERCWRDYRLYAAQGLITAVMAGFLTSRTERGDRMFATMIDRHARQMIDHGTLAMIA
jgi:hypothetical protein